MLTNEELREQLIILKDRTFLYRIENLEYLNNINYKEAALKLAGNILFYAIKGCNLYIIKEVIETIREFDSQESNAINEITYANSNVGDITGKIGSGFSPLYIAILYDNFEAITLLIEAGIHKKLSHQTNSIYTGITIPFFQAYYKFRSSFTEEKVEILELLHTPNDQNEAVYLRIVYIKIGNLDKVKLITPLIKNINTGWSNGWAITQFASMHNRLEILKYLVENGASLEVSTIKGRTPLGSALKERNGAIVEYILDKIPNKESHITKELEKIASGFRIADSHNILKYTWEILKNKGLFESSIKNNFLSILTAAVKNLQFDNVKLLFKEINVLPDNIIEILEELIAEVPSSNKAKTNELSLEIKKFLVIYLVETLNNKVITSLELDVNNLDYESIKLIKEAIEKNLYITKINIHNCDKLSEESNGLIKNIYFHVERNKETLKNAISILEKESKAEENLNIEQINILLKNLGQFHQLDSFFISFYKSNSLLGFKNMKSRNSAMNFDNNILNHIADYLTLDDLKNFQIASLISYFGGMKQITPVVYEGMQILKLIAASKKADKILINKSSAASILKALKKENVDFLTIIERFNKIIIKKNKDNKINSSKDDLDISTSSENAEDDARESEINTSQIQLFQENKKIEHNLSENIYKKRKATDIDKSPLEMLENKRFNLDSEFEGSTDSPNAVAMDIEDISMANIAPMPEYLLIAHPAQEIYDILEQNIDADQPEMPSNEAISSLSLDQLDILFNHPEIKSLFVGGIGVRNFDQINQLSSIFKRAIKLTYKYLSPDGREESYTEVFNQYFQELEDIEPINLVFDQNGLRLEKNYSQVLTNEIEIATRYDIYDPSIFANELIANNATNTENGLYFVAYLPLEPSGLVTFTNLEHSIVN